MLNVILQTDHVFYLNAASLIHAVSSHLVHIAFRLVLQASKEVAVQHLQRLHWEVIATASHLFSSLVAVNNKHCCVWQWIGYRRMVRPVEANLHSFLSLCVYFFFCRQNLQTANYSAVGCSHLLRLRWCLHHPSWGLWQRLYQPQQSRQYTHHISPFRWQTGTVQFFHRNTVMH